MELEFTVLEDSFLGESMNYSAIEKYIFHSQFSREALDKTVV